LCGQLDTYRLGDQMRLWQPFPRHSSEGSYPRVVFKRTLLLCLALAAIVFGFSLQKIDAPAVSLAPLQFKAQNAFDTMKGLSKGFPYRVTWSDSRKKAGVWLKDQFRKIGYEPQSLFFSEVIAGRHYDHLEDIYAIKRGTTHPDEIILAAAHYDVADGTIEGAMDDASGIGVVLELARIFSKVDTSRTIIFLATDSEEFGAFWGSKAFVNDFPNASKIIAVENFDFVAPDKQTKIMMLCDGLKQGFTPLWLREIALQSILSVGGARPIDFTNIVESFQRALEIPAADHASFLAAGIPAFNWTGQTDEFAYEMAHYHHTVYDTVEAMEPESFESFGKSAERVMRTVDELKALPPDYKNSSYLKINSHYFISGLAVLLLHILAFIPFLAFSVCKFSLAFRQTPTARIFTALKHEAKFMGIVLLSFLSGYLVLLSLPFLKIITQYETFPATQKSKILDHPNLGAILIVFGSVIVTYFVLKRVFKGPEADPLESNADAPIRHALHAAALTLIIFLAMIKNSHLATLMLLPPAYFWTSLQDRSQGKVQLRNLLLLLGGAVTFMAAIVVMTTLFHVGVVYWYLFLASAYGLFSAYSILLFVMSMTVMIRLFRAFVL
jgi:hypothetical protein